MENKSKKILGKKIKKIEVNRELHRRVLLVLLITFNILLIAALIYFSASLKHWVAYLISAALLGYCSWQSVMTYLHSKECHKYTICEKGISLKSIWYDQKIFYKDILMVEVHKSMWDKIFKIDSTALIIYLKSNKKRKIVLPFILNNAEQVCDELLSYVIASRENKTALDVMAEKNKSKIENG